MPVEPATLPLPKFLCMKQQVSGYFLPVFIFFIVINTLTLTGSSLFAKWNADRYVVMAGNLVLFGATVLSMLIYAKSFASDNPNAFGRSLYGSFLIRFFACALAAAIYILVVRKDVNKPGLIICMGLYIVYTFLEVRTLTRILKQKKNA